MSATREIISALVAGGMDAVDAAALVARAAFEMTAGAAPKSSGAIRQQRYRDRNESVTKRNETVTEHKEPDRNEPVTNRNESVTRYAAPLSKEDKKEIVRKEKRASQLPDGWRPDDGRWLSTVDRLGSEDRAERELRKFTSHAVAKGRVAKNWNAAWDGWVEKALEWGNGDGINNHRANPAAGRATAREAQHVATMGAAALRYLRESKSAGSGREAPDGLGTAEIVDIGKRAENAR